ncbi:hypothetical protein HanPI659440_Chr11g0411091 [Helianthus annuus]|nr:hypothetical protein HanPI659440_Chr11g0411091 [Helianthus annuus]
MNTSHVNIFDLHPFVSMHFSFKHFAALWVPSKYQHAPTAYTMHVGTNYCCFKLFGTQNTYFETKMKEI